MNSTMMADSPEPYEGNLHVRGCVGVLGNRCFYPEEGPGYLRGVLESIWFRKSYLLSEILGFKAQNLTSPLAFKSPA